jgi:eukaryotic-like serine/threonine-protein kinase
MELTVQNVYGLLIRSKLLTIDEARAMFSRWQTEAGDNAKNLVRFASWMVANKYLTEYQATLLARGHADGFFLDEYKILDRIGKGRMAGVYQARHPLGQRVAVKVLPPSKARDTVLLARFQREAKLALKLRHANIVRGFQVGLANGLHYLVMEYLEGETLEDVLVRRGKFPPAEAVRLIYQALQGLQHIHAQGVVHRDLKPSNLMLVSPPGKILNKPDGSTLDYTVKILDIGLGRSLDENPDVDAALTSEGVLLGTPDYMAPEQARDPRSIDIRADIYSLGCVLYQLLSGTTPFPDSNIISQMIRHAQDTPRPLRNFNPAVSEGLEKIVGFMMAKDPANRYPTPERAYQALEVFLAADAVPASSPDIDPSMRTYIAWVEEQTKKAPPALTAKPPSGTVPTAAPVTPSKPPPVPTSSKRNKHEKRRKRHAQTRADGFNVELVSVPAGPLPIPKPPAPTSAITRRDLFAFGLGVGSTLLAILVGWLLRRKKPEEP